MKKLIVRLFSIIFLYATYSTSTPPKLYNFGNTCYLNATIQCLYNIDYVKNLALFTHRINPYPSNSLANLFIKLVHGMHTLPPINALTYHNAEQKLWDTQLKNFVHKSYEIMGGCGQQDAEEFIGKLIDSLIAEDTRYKAPTTEQQLKLNPFGKILKIETTSTLSCPSVNFKSIKKEASSRLNIQTQNDLGTEKFDTLQKCLDNYFITENNIEYKPEGHQQQNNCSKKLEIAELSDVVIIILKRFATDFTQETLPTIKLNHVISIPLTFNFRTYLNTDALKKPIASYTLIAAAQHLGNTLTSGHYVAHIKEPSGQWYYCSDTTIQQETVEAAQQAINKSYIFVYRKNDKK